MNDMIEEMTGSGGVDAQMAIEQLRALVRELEATVSPRLVEPRPPTEPATLPPTAGSVMDWLRADLAARTFGNAASAYVELSPLTEPAPAGGEITLAGSVVQPPELHVGTPEEPVAAMKDAYTVAELLVGRRAIFVRNAYRAIMRREPDPEGFHHFDRRLASNEITRLETLLELRYSAEGRAQRVSVKGLGQVRVARVVRRIPIVGTVLAILHALARLPGMALRLERVEHGAVENYWHFSSALQRAQEALRDSESRRHALALEHEAAIRGLDGARAQLRAHLLSVHGAVAQLQSSDLALRRWAAVFGENLTSVDAAARRLQSALELRATREDLKRALEEVVAVLAPLAALPWELERHKGTVALIEAGAKQALLRVKEVEERHAGDMERVEAGAKQALLRVKEVEQRHAGDMERVAAELPSQLWAAAGGPLDDFYAAFENRFRGTWEDIKSRMSVYVPRIEETVAATGPAPVLDIGTGRGEWLELLREKGLAARGVDSSAAMVRTARERGVDVVEADALQYVRNLAPESLSAVTAFHVIEHLPFPILTTLVRECFRVLKPGGLVLFETPNPENLIVGAHTFWYDPTHLRPLPPDMMQFVVESQGFERAEVLRLHPNEPWERLPDAVPAEVRDRLNALLYGARDYSIVAYKPMHTAGPAA